MDFLPRLIVGLGNPGPRYAGTRHNAGALVVEELRRRWPDTPAKVLCNSIVNRIAWRGREIDLAVPLTWMNRSGTAVAPLAREFGLLPAEILVCYDCLDLPLGRLRLRLNGSSGGHRGVESIIQELGTPMFPRLRLGIGRPPAGCEVADFVTSPWNPEELPQAAQMTMTGADAVLAALEQGVAAAMNRWNAEKPVAKVDATHSL
jgi:PTH1 family peptidyl-tRNA hydrolase